jgi:hypothetical protein
MAERRPIQHKLFRAAQARKKAAREDTYDEQNTLAAQIILSAPARHGGDGSLSVRWARGFMERKERENA